MSSPTSLVSSGLRTAFLEGYTCKHLKSDIMAGIVVGLVALPLSMALAISSGVPPQHGLYTAIVAGCLAPLLGGARFNVTGPTAAFVVVLAPVASKYGIGGLAVASLMAGLLLLAMGLLGLGRLIRFIPHPVTTGFTAGIALVIATLQIKDFLGLAFVHSPESFLDRLTAIAQALPGFRWQECCVGAVTLVVLFAWPRRFQALPSAVAAMGLSIVFSRLLSFADPGWHVDTIGSRFTYSLNGVVGAGVPPSLPHLALPWTGLHLNSDLLMHLAGPALAIAVLGAIESLLCAVVADGMTDNRHNPDAELIGQGAANLVAPFFGGFAATGAIARTAASIRAGAHSPLSAVFHAVFLLGAVMSMGPLLSRLPMAALAALLLSVAWNMSDQKNFSHILKVAPRSDKMVLLVCFALTVLFDMVVGVGIGIVCAALLFMKRMADTMHTRLVTKDSEAFPRNVPRDVIVYDITGPLFFGAAEKTSELLNQSGADHRSVIFNFQGVPAMDVTGLLAFQKIVNTLRQRGTKIIITHLKPQPAQLLRRAGIVDGQGDVTICEEYEEALFVVRSHALLSPEAYTV